MLCSYYTLAIYHNFKYTSTMKERHIHHGVHSNQTHKGGPSTTISSIFHQGFCKSSSLLRAQSPALTLPRVPYKLVAAVVLGVYPQIRQILLQLICEIRWGRHRRLGSCKSIDIDHEEKKSVRKKTKMRGLLEKQWNFPLQHQFKRIKYK